ATWGAPKAICSNCANQGQYDVSLAVTSGGIVYATFMKQYDIMFARSSDHGATWAPATRISGGTWADKPWMATSANGTDVYVTWTTRGNLYAVNSHNAGASFSAPLQVTNETNIYYYSNGGTVLPNGTALMVGSEYPENGNNTKNTGPVPLEVFRTANVGTSCSRAVVDALTIRATLAR